MSSLKQQVYAACNNLLDDRIKAVETEMDAMQHAVTEETKSSAGDKYETGRAMLHLEIEKLSSQYEEFIKSKKILSQIDPLRSFPVIQSGSVVITKHHHYFLSVSVGQVKVGDREFFCISPASPMGQLLMGHKAGDHLSFRNQSISILEIH